MREDEVVIYREEKGFQTVKRYDSRLDWNWPHTPPGMVKFTIRNKWTYVYVGANRSECAFEVNRFNMERIRSLQDQIRNLEKLLVKAHN